MDSPRISKRRRPWKKNSGNSTLGQLKKNCSYSNYRQLKCAASLRLHIEDLDEDTLSVISPGLEVDEILTMFQLDECDRDSALSIKLYVDSLFGDIHESVEYTSTQICDDVNLCFDVIDSELGQTSEPVYFEDDGFNVHVPGTTLGTTVAAYNYSVSLPQGYYFSTLDGQVLFAEDLSVHSSPSDDVTSEDVTITVGPYVIPQSDKINIHNDGTVVDVIQPYTYIQASLKRSDNIFTLRPWHQSRDETAYYSRLVCAQILKQPLKLQLLSLFELLDDERHKGLRLALLRLIRRHPVVKKIREHPIFSPGLHSTLQSLSRKSVLSMYARACSYTCRLGPRNTYRYVTSMLEVLG